jgi:hypothetical protein
MSFASMMMSPILIPTRKVSRFSSAVFALRDARPRWILIAQATASTALGNSARRPSPVVLTIRPCRAAIVGSINSPRCARSARSVPTSSALIGRL